MHIGVIGATGGIGSRVVTEALGRGHRVTALTRDASLISEKSGDVVGRGDIEWKSVDVLNADGIAAILPGLDVLISGFQPGNAAKDLAGAVQRSIAEPTLFSTAARALLTAMESHPRTRLVVIGGVGSLEVEPGRVLADSDELLHATLDELGLPREYAAAVRGHQDALDVLRLSNRRWTYFSPAKEIFPGRRTGRFRLGDDQLVVDADGRSRISMEDAAVALVDEVELPRYVQRRFTIGY